MCITVFLWTSVHQEQIHEKAKSSNFHAPLSHILYSLLLWMCVIIFIWLLIVIECCAKCMCCCCSTHGVYHIDIEETSMSMVYHQVSSPIFRNLPHNFFVTLIHQCIVTCAPILNRPLADIIAVIIYVNWVFPFLCIGSVNLQQYSSFIFLPHTCGCQHCPYSVNIFFCAPAYSSHNQFIYFRSLGWSRRFWIKHWLPGWGLECYVNIIFLFMRIR